MALFLGLDTSAYTTSIALVNHQHQVVVDERIPLMVKPGERGLRQSQALFFMFRTCPSVFNRLPAGLSGEVVAIAASAWPRRVKDSYMPVFLAGQNQADIERFCRPPALSGQPSGRPYNGSFAEQ